MTDEEAFQRTILANPADDLTRLVYADWLEERGDPDCLAKAEFLRTQHRLQTGEELPKKAVVIARLGVLARRLPSRWLAVVSRLPIENCPSNPPPRIGLAVVYHYPPVRFDFECPKEWAELQATNKPGIRDCGTCKQQVFYCNSIEEARRLAWQGQCIAVDCSIPRKRGDLERHIRMGKLMPDAIRRARQLQRLQLLQPDEAVEE